MPGLESFELKHYRGSTESRGFAYAVYRTLELACYAKRKLDGLEYPPGHKLIVKYAEERPAGNRDRQVQYNYRDRRFINLLDYLCSGDILLALLLSNL